MVRKTVIFVLALLALLSALPISASAYQVYNQGNISTTYITYFEDIVTKIDVDSHYVFFRNSETEYCLVVGKELYYDGGVFIGALVDVYTIYTTSQGYNSYYHYKTTTETTFVLNPQDSLVYSDLGYYPDVREDSIKYETCIILILSIILFMSIINSIFSWSKCRRYS